MFIQLTQAVEITSFQMGSGTLFTLEDETNVVTEGVVNIAAFGGATVSGASAPYSATVSLTMGAVGHGVMIALTLPAVGDHYLTFFGKIVHNYCSSSLDSRARSPSARILSDLDKICSDR